MTEASTQRRRVRLDYAIRALNGNRLPRFKGYVYASASSPGDYIGWVTPYDGTPETAVDIVRATCQSTSMRPAYIGVILEEGTADILMKTCPSFYQHVTMLKEQY